jgi:hypothetical protein
MGKLNKRTDVLERVYPTMQCIRLKRNAGLSEGRYRSSSNGRDIKASIYQTLAKWNAEVQIITADDPDARSPHLHDPIPPLSTVLDESRRSMTFGASMIADGRLRQGI